MDSKAEGGDQNRSESGTQSGKYKSALWVWINVIMGYNYRRTPSIWKAYNCIIIYKLVLQTDPNRITHPRDMLFQMRAINGSILCTHELLRSEFTLRMTDVRLGNDIWEKEHLGSWEHIIVSYVFDGIYYQLRMNVDIFRSDTNTGYKLALRLFCMVLTIIWSLMLYEHLSIEKEIIESGDGWQENFNYEPGRTKGTYRLEDDVSLQYILPSV